jgi:Sugar (and other) transporter
MYFLYISLCLISTVIVYIFVPETKGLPVEEIGEIFGDKVVIHLTSDGHGILEMQSLLMRCTGRFRSGNAC